MTTKKLAYTAEAINSALDSIFAGGMPALFINSKMYETLESADEAAVAAGQILLINDNYPLLSSLTINADILVLRGCGFTQSASYTLTINGHLLAWSYAIFTGFDAGEVIFAAGSFEKALPQWWGAQGDDSADDTLAIQCAIDACEAAGGGTVFFPQPPVAYKIGSASPYFLTLKNSVSIVGETAGAISGLIIPGGGLTGVIIRPRHGVTHYPAIISDPDHNIFNFKVENFVIDFGAENADLPSTHADDCGFKFTGSYFPGCMLLHNIVVKYAYYGYYDTGSAWMSTLHNIWLFACRNGFYKVNGTTFQFTNCFAKGNQVQDDTAHAWYLESVVSSSLTACAMDNFYSKKVGYFIGCQGLTINGFDAESNETSDDFGALIKFTECDGMSVKGLGTFATTVHTTSGKEGYLVLLAKCTGELALTAGGHRNDTCDGDGTYVFTLVFGNNPNGISSVTVTGKIETLTGGASLTMGKVALASSSPIGTKILREGLKISNASGGILELDINGTFCNLLRAGSFSWSDSSGTIAIDWRQGGTQYGTLTGTGRTVTFANMVEGQVYRIPITQGSGGSKTITTWPTMTWLGGGTAPTLSTVEGKTDIITVLRSNGICYGDCRNG